MAVFTAIATGLSLIGATVLGTAATGTLLGAVVGGAMIGAVVGGIVAAVKGENILSGALTGGLWGAAAGGALGVASMWAGGMAGTEGAISLTQAGAAVEAGTGVAVESGVAVGGAEGGVVTATQAAPGLETAASGQLGAVFEPAAAVAEKGVVAGLTAGDKIAGAGLILGTAGQLMTPDPIDAAAERRKRFELGEFNPAGAEFQWEDEFNTVGRFEEVNKTIDDEHYRPQVKYSAGWWKGKPATAGATAGAKPSPKPTAK